MRDPIAINIHICDTCGIDQSVLPFPFLESVLKYRYFKEIGHYPYYKCGDCVEISLLRTLRVTLQKEFDG